MEVEVDADADAEGTLGLTAVERRPSLAEADCGVTEREEEAGERLMGEGQRWCG